MNLFDYYDHIDLYVYSKNVQSTAEQTQNRGRQLLIVNSKWKRQNRGRRLLIVNCKWEKIILFSSQWTMDP